MDPASWLVTSKKPTSTSKQGSGRLNLYFRRLPSPWQNFPIESVFFS